MRSGRDAPARGPSPEPRPPGGSPRARLGLSELEAAAPRCSFALALSLFGGACGCSLQKVTSCLGGWRWCFVEPCFPPPAFGRPACKQVEARSLNVNGSEPEVGSAFAGQTSFAGWRSRGRGSNGGGTSETPGCWERQGEGGGRGREQGAWSEGKGAAASAGWGCGSPACPRRAASSPLRLQLRLIAERRPALPAGHRRVPGFPNPAAFQPEPIPSGSPFLTCFPAQDFFFFFLLAAKYLRATWSLVLGCLFPPPLAPRRGGGLGERAEDAEDSPSRAEQRSVNGWKQHRKGRHN